MTQPAVTRQVRQLERSLGAELFDRSANRSAPTDLGRRLLGHVATGLDLIEAGLAELADHAGTFVLATHPGIAQQWLVPRIDDLQLALGAIELRLWLFDRDTDLAEGHYDAAIRVGNGSFEGDGSHRLFPEVVVPVAAPTFADEHHLTSESSPRDVYGAPLVHMDDGDKPWMSWTDWLAEFDITLRRPPGRVLFNNYPMVVQQAIAGRGVALGWRPLIDELIDTGVLVVVGPQVHSQRGYYVTWPGAVRLPAVEHLIEWLDVAARPESDR